MILKTLKQKQNVVLTLDDEFLQYCKLNNIEDVEKLARETFNQGFTILKYGKFPLDVTPIKKEVKENPKMQSDNIIPVMPMNFPDGTGLISAMDKVTKKTDIYGE